MQCRYRSDSKGGNSRTATNRQGDSASGTYHSEEYPWATDPPIITKTTAAQAAAGEAPSAVVTPTSTTKSMTSSLLDMFASPISNKESTANTESKDQQPTSISSRLASVFKSYNDPFDDQGSISPTERAQILAKQNEDQAQNSLSPLVQSISEVPPTYLASSPTGNTSTQTLTAAQLKECQITTLSNGIRVATLPNPGSPVTALGCVSQLASKFESPHNSGATHLWELMGVPVATIEDGTHLANIEFAVATGREQSIYCTEVSRPHTEYAVQALASFLSDPISTMPMQGDNPENFLMAQSALAFQAQNNDGTNIMPPEIALQDALHAAAYGTDQALGHAHFLDTPHRLTSLQWPHVLEHWQRTVSTNPGGLVFGAIGVDDHVNFCEMVERYLGSMQQQEQQPLSVTPSIYRGGRCIVDLPVNVKSDDVSEVARAKRLTRIALVWPTGGWHDNKSFIAACLLQALWGGGSAFSEGGPGKGMYSRLYLTLLNQNAWIESAEAHSAFYDEAGLLGFVGSTSPDKAREFIKLCCQQLLWLARKPVTPHELSRAKNMLRCNVLMQLESRLVAFEDLTRQVATYGKHEPMRITAERISEVTEADLQQLAIQMLEHPPSLAVVGMELHEKSLPSKTELEQWLKL